MPHIERKPVVVEAYLPQSDLDQAASLLQSRLSPDEASDFEVFWRRTFDPGDGFGDVTLVVDIAALPDYDGQSGNLTGYSLAQRGYVIHKGETQSGRMEAGGVRVESAPWEFDVLVDDGDGGSRSVPYTLTIKPDPSPLMRFTAENGVPFAVRIVRQGAPFGRGFCLVNEDEEPLVEFYDNRSLETFDPGLGQFVSRYYLSTLLARQHDEHGLCLDGGEPSWAVDAASMKKIRSWLVGNHPEYSPIEGLRQYPELAVTIPEKADDGLPSFSL